MHTHPFLNELAEIRRRARWHIGEGAGSIDRNAVVRLLNTALATELVCALRYRRYNAMRSQALGDGIKDEFAKRAQEEQSHADQIAARIVELGGEPNPDPPSAPYDGDDKSYADDENLTDMLAEDLIAERIAIDTYREIIRYMGDSDSATLRLFESIVTVEQEHAAGLASMREDIQRQQRAVLGANHDGHTAADTR
ncbi:MAG TPA: ferritin-like domain-containing protein [Steroidobacteraceae bacterium]